MLTVRDIRINKTQSLTQFRYTTNSSLTQFKYITKSKLCLSVGFRPD